MIRNGYCRRLAAEAERAHLLQQWLVYPEGVRHCLHALLQEHGLRAAQLATEAVDYFYQQQRLFASEQAHEEKEQRDDACTS